MARGNNQGLSSARSEISYSDKLRLRESEEDKKYDNYKSPTLAEYEKDWEKLTNYKPFKDLKFGDGVVGNGIIKNGELHLRDEDIKTIVERQFNDDVFGYTIERNGYHKSDFFPFLGDNNYNGSNPLGGFESHAIFAEGERQVNIDYNAERVEKLENSVKETFLKIDYEKAMGNSLKIEQDSVERLAKAIEKAMTYEQSRITERIEEETDYKAQRDSEQADHEMRSRRDEERGY